MDRSQSRRLKTPECESRRRPTTDTTRRSRSRSRRDSVQGQRRSRMKERSNPRDSSKLREMERQLERERERLRDLQDDLYRERSRIRRTVSKRRETDYSNRSRRSPSTPIERIASRRRERSPIHYDDSPERQKRRVEPSDRRPKSSSPSFSTKDIVNILNSLKNTKSQPSTTSALHTYSSNNHKNILPDFDPSSKNQRIDIWIKKVNECATVYCWDDKTTIHFAMQKLQGLAKVWYESLPSILFSWAEWQNKLQNAFPCEQNYGQTLEDMLRRKSRYNEPIEVYFYEKLALLIKCNIDGKRAVDCIIHGLTDRTMKSSATTLRCEYPEQLLQFLMSNKETTSFDRTQLKSRFSDASAGSNGNKVGNKVNPTQNSNIFCYNCKEKGHPFLKCPKPIVKCGKCNKMGHKSDNCFSQNKNDVNNIKSDNLQKTMRISNAKPNSKFFKEVLVNNKAVKSFIDFGSEVSLISESLASSLGLSHSSDSIPLKGFGNEIVRTLGGVCVSLSVDGVVANVNFQVVPDRFLELPVLIGQSFTEQSHIVVYKNAETLSFSDIGGEMPFSGIDMCEHVVVKVVVQSTAHIHGLANIKAVTDPKIDGNILIDSKIIGQPLQQLVVLGGMYPVKGGTVHVLISPVSVHSYIRSGTVISRGIRVVVVNKITSQPTDTLEKLRIDVDQVRIGNSIETRHREILLNLLNKYRQCFASSLDELGCTNVTEMTIEVNNNKPVVYRPYRLSYKERETVREMITDMLEAGIIRESVSEYASPIILVRKKDDKITYIDDVLIYGKTVEECLGRLENVLQLIESANLTLNLSKCEFLKDKIDYLGYEIGIAGIRPGNRKIQCVLEFPCPTDQHTVRQFLGLVGYFRKFIHNFATLANPLTKLLAKNAVWAWTHEQQNAFESLKAKLVDRPILAIYDPSAETELHTDASKMGVGGVLLQKSKDSNLFKPVAYYSRKTSPEERNFHAYELETLAVICSLKKFRVYLLGQEFKVVTDCSALRSTFSKRDVLPRIARWWLLMQEFQCSIEYRPGVKMAHVDDLSRNPIADSETSEVLEQYPAVMNISSEDWLHTLQLGDAELNRIRDVLSSNIDSDGLKYIRDNYLIKDNRLYRYLDGDQNNIRWVVPKGARWQLCRMNHDDIGHFGIDKTLERLKNTYWFSKMSKFVKKYVNACIECAYAKKNNSGREGFLHPIVKVEVPFHTLHVDHLGPFVKSKRGNAHLLVIVDGFTKFVFIKPVRNTKTQSAIRALEDIFNTFRIPDRIISDRGTCFTSHAFKRFCNDKGMKHVLNAVASPRSNGQVERYNRTILNSLTAQNLNRNERDWDDTVGTVQWGLNNTCQKTTGRTPAELMFGTSMISEVNPKLNEVRRETRELIDLTTIRENAKDAIDVQQEKQKLRYDKGRHEARVYAEGELVKITKTSFANDGKSKKLLPAYIGPYRVISVLGNDRYRIAAIPGLTGSKNKRQTTVAADRMLPWVNIAALEVNDSDISDNDNDMSDNDKEDN